MEFGSVILYRVGQSLHTPCRRTNGHEVTIGHLLLSLAAGAVNVIDLTQTRVPSGTRCCSKTALYLHGIKRRHKLKRVGSAGIRWRMIIRTTARTFRTTNEKQDILSLSRLAHRPAEFRHSRPLSGRSQRTRVPP